MNFQDLQLKTRKKNATKIAPFVALAILFTLIPIYYPSMHHKKLSQILSSSLVPLPDYHTLHQSSNSITTQQINVTKSSDEHVSVAAPHEARIIINGTDDEKCDLFLGEWVENQEGPYYTNMTCFAIQEHQNCMKYGRPDTDFLKWKWKPDGCELPIFDAHQFLEIVRGKSLAFVGDSVARNHMQSLICLLSKVMYPIDVSNSTDQENRRWEYRDYNFNMSIFWTPYLVKANKTEPNNIYQPFNLYLDELDESWTTKIQDFDYVIISAGHWFFRPTMFYLNHTLVGCLFCSQPNVSQMTSFFSYQRAFQTAFRAINSLENYKGVTFLRTFAPSHFEDGVWDKGGDCVRTIPFKRKEKMLEDYNLEFYKIQLQELTVAQKQGKNRDLKFRLFDATQPMLLRPDGHPSKYGHWPNPNVTLSNDCVHWCLPGPIDVWNDFLLELMKREEIDR
ncbi:protein trichome birefringence-like 19 [Solanum dulcamara]|uniref:protein trichome birefringence-like 19 n=1 Tax=Solanum dulcamara TaxID=45834 RepID=UPI0024868F55|nr:protein trichome birefringence-like 19 [Solanum dulcamara]